MQLVTFNNIFNERIGGMLFDSIKLKSPSVIETKNTNFEDFQSKLVSNFCFQWHLGELFWPRELIKRTNRHIPQILREAMIGHGRSMSIDSILHRMGTMVHKK